MTGGSGYSITHGDVGDKGHTYVRVKAGKVHTEHVVPPAGEKYAFDHEVWTHNIEVAISPTGRSVRVFINGEEVKGGTR